MLMKYLFVLFLLLVASPTFAQQVIHTQEFDGASGTPPIGWSCSFVGCPILQSVNSPSGGTSLAANMVAGAYSTNGSGGIYTYDSFRDFNRTEYYQGFWIKWSANFVWHPIASKFWLSFQKNTAGTGLGTDNAVLIIQNNGTALTFTQQLWRAPGTSNKPGNVGSINIVRDRWYWVEVHLIENSMAGPTTPNQDGLIEVWFDDVLKMRHTNAVHRTSENNVFGGQQIVNIWGGGCNPACTAPAQSIYFDHVVFSTSRIGMPGGTPPPIDVTPPSVPGAVTATVSGSTASLTIASASTDPESGVTGYSRYRCTGISCSPTVSVGTQPGLTFLDTGLTASTTYGYAYKATNGVGLQSAATSTVYITTPAAATLYFTPIFFDDFLRANGTLGANWTGSFTARSDFSLVSNQVRVGSLGSEFLQVYNGTTPNDQYAKAQLPIIGGNGAVTPGVNLRMQTGPAVNGIVCQADLVANTSTIRELTNGSYGDITAPYSGWTYAPLDYIWCEAEGTTYRMYAERSGVKTLLASGTDVTHASGKAGISNNVAASGTGEIEYVGGQSGSFAGTTSAQTINFALTGGLASVPAADDLVIIHYAIGSNGSGATSLLIRNTTATNYTLFGPQLYANDTVDAELRSAYRVQPGTPETQFVLSATPTAGTGSTNNAGTYVVQVFRGVDATILEQAVQQGTGTNTHLVDFGSITPTTPGTVVVAAGSGGLEVSGAAYTTSGLTAFLSPVGATDGVESSIGAGYVPWVSGPVAPATFSAGGTAHAFNAYAWSLIALKPGSGGVANTTATSQLDNFEMGSISSTQATPPTITDLTATTSTINVAYGPTTPTSVRIHYGDNAGSFSYNVIRPIADFSDGVLTLSMPVGTQFLCAHPYNLAGEENTAVDAYACVGQTYLESILGTLDTAPATFGTVMPNAELPVDTTSTIISVELDKPAACRMDTVDQDYDLMDVDTTAVQMSSVNQLCSTSLTGLTNGSSTTRYIASQFTNSAGGTYNSTPQQTITVTVANSTVDTTPPGQVLNLVAQAIPDSADVLLTWLTATGGDVAFYRVYISTDNATYILSGNSVLITNTQRALTPNTPFYFKVEAVDTSGNAGALSVEASATTFSTPDREPPSVPTGITLDIFTESGLFGWATGTDNAGLVYTQVEACSGIGCTNFIALGPRVATSQLVAALTPNTFYRVRLIHYDASGNPSGGLDNPTYSTILEFTTNLTGLPSPRLTLPSGTDRVSSGGSRLSSSTRLER